jgi:hypothetical protein
MKPQLSFFRQVFVVGLALSIAGAGAAVAQTPVPSTVPGQTAAAVRSPQQLDDLVAPIALYPDPLLGQVLAASTYPLEIVEAQQWVTRNSGLRGAALMDAAKQQNWDPSVQALVAFPDLLARLNSDVSWTTDLGNAFLAQQADVMYAVQRMRASAQANGKLSSSPQQVVTTQTDNGQSAIQIQPANPQVIYVPTYDPAYIWGPPAWGYYPSLYYPGFGFGFWPGINVGLYFGGWGWGGWGGWGWGPNWFGHGLFVNAGFFRNYGFRGGYGGVQGIGAWAHNPAHRLGVPYSNGQLAQRFQAASRSSAAAMGSRFTPGQSFGANRGAYQRSQSGGGQYGNRYGAQGSQGYRSGAQNYQSYRGSAGQSYQSYRGSAGQNSTRSYQSRPSFQSAPRYSAPSSSGSTGRSFGGGAARSFGGGGHSFGGGGHSSGGGGHRR